MKKSSMILTAVVFFMAASTAVAALIPPGVPDPVRYFALDETANPSTGLTAVDSGTASQNGTYDGYSGGNGPTVGVTAPVGLNGADYGTAAYFDGVDSVVNLGSGLGQLTNNLSISAWIKPDEIDRFGYIISDDTWDSENGYGWGLFVRGLKNDDGQENKLCLLAPGQAGRTTTDAFITAADVGKWTHVAVTVSNTEGVGVYKNGQFVETLDSYTPVASSHDYWIGCGFGADDAPWKGGLDEVMVFDQLLTGGQVAALAGVPEPSAIYLLMIGTISLVAYAWRKRK